MDQQPHPQCEFGYQRVELPKSEEFGIESYGAYSYNYVITLILTLCVSFNLL